jgi:hypothetical protein
MSCIVQEIDKEIAEKVLDILEEKYKNTDHKVALSQYEDEVKTILTRDELSKIENYILSKIPDNEKNDIPLFDYDQLIKNVCVLLPEKIIGGDPDTDVVVYDKPLYFSFSSKDFRTDIFTIFYFLISLSVIYLGISRIDKFNEQITKGELDLQISYLDLVSFQALWSKIKGHNFCETIAYNIINRAIEIGVKTTVQAKQNCWTFNPDESKIAFVLSAVESWVAPQTTMNCIKDFAYLEFEKMKLVIKHSANSLPLGFSLLWFGIGLNGSCIGYFAYRLGLNKMASNVIENIQKNIENAEPSRIAGGCYKKSKKNRKYKKKTRKNHRRSRRTRK